MKSKLLLTVFLVPVFLFFFSALFFAVPAFAETAYETIWTMQLGSSSNDYAYSVAVDSSGNAYVTGCTLGGLDGNTNAGQYDIFLTKYDTDGKKLWTRQLGTSTVDSAEGVAVDSSGNVYVAGYTYGGLDGNTNAGDYDLFVMKLGSVPPVSLTLTSPLQHHCL